MKRTFLSNEEIIDQWDAAVNKRIALDRLAVTCRTTREGMKAKLLELGVTEEELDAVPEKKAPARHYAKRKTPTNAKLDEARARELYDEGKNDHEIGRTLGFSDSTIWAWRKRRGLEANASHGGRPKAMTEELCRRAREMYDAGAHDPDIAEALQVDRQVIFDWRKKNDLPAHPRRYEKKQEGKAMKKDSEQTTERSEPCDPCVEPKRETCDGCGNEGSTAIAPRITMEPRKEPPRRETPEEPKPLSLGELRRYLTEFLPAVLNEAQLDIDGAPVTEFYGFTVTSPNGVPTVDILTRRG